MGGNTQIQLNLRLKLGGDCPASGKMRADMLVKTIDYLSVISSKRSALIADLKKTL
jgi:hypothetical protein